MFGSILGDIVGSRFEFSKPKGFNAKTVELFTDDCFFTDDTVMSIATKYAIPDVPIVWRIRSLERNILPSGMEQCLKNG